MTAVIGAQEGADVGRVNGRRWIELVIPGHCDVVKYDITLICPGINAISPILNEGAVIYKDVSQVIRRQISTFDFV